MKGKLQLNLICLHFELQMTDRVKLIKDLSEKFVGKIVNANGERHLEGSADRK